MKMNPLKLTLFIILGIIITIGYVYFSAMYSITKEAKKHSQSVVEIEIFNKENIDGLKRIDFTICDIKYAFNSLEIKDTVHTVLKIYNKKPPCNVSFVYVFKDGKTKEIFTNDFDCAGCSGLNTYGLMMNSVEYKYNP